MIDIHSHILPAVDDGCESMEQAITMARQALAAGITDVIATPHHANGKFLNEADQVTVAVQQLNLALQTEAIGLTVHPGQEIRVYQELLEDLHEGKLLTLADSRYMLLELPTAEVPRQLDELLHELTIDGIRPIIAHPERNLALADDPDKLARLIDNGALAQVTTQSIEGLFGSKIRKAAITMCERNLIHLLSTDAHNAHRRGFSMTESINRLRDRCGESYVHYLLGNAAKVLQDGEINRLSPKLHTRRRLLFWK